MPKSPIYIVSFAPDKQVQFPKIRGQIKKKTRPIISHNGSHNVRVAGAGANNDHCGTLRPELYKPPLHMRSCKLEDASIENLNSIIKSTGVFNVSRILLVINCDHAITLITNYYALQTHAVIALYVGVVISNIGPAVAFSPYLYCYTYMIVCTSHMASLESIAVLHYCTFTLTS